MTYISAGIKSEIVAMHGRSPGVVLRSLIIGLTAFLTVVDLFATQAILPSLARHYNVSPAAMGFAVNSSTMGMAIAGLVVGFFSQHIDRRLGILLSLAILAVPTTLLAVAPNLAVFTILRVMQGLCMASAFALTLALWPSPVGANALRVSCSAKIVVGDGQLPSTAGVFGTGLPGVSRKASKISW